MKREEKIPFLKAVLTIAKADNDTDIREVMFYQQLCLELGLGNDELAHIQTQILSEKGTLEEFLDQITERKTKLLLLYKMMLLSYADGRVDDTETAVIKKTADYLQIEEEKYREIEEAARENEELRKKTDRVLEADA